MQSNLAAPSYYITEDGHLEKKAAPNRAERRSKDERSSLLEQDRLIDEKRAADLLGMSVAWLRLGRAEGRRGRRTATPPYIQCGEHSIRYQLSDLLAWIAKNRRTTGTESAQ